MPAKYQTVQKGNPADPDAPKKYYAQVIQRGVCDLHKLAKEASERSSLTKGDMLSAFENLAELAMRHLAEGETVELGSLGTLVLSVSSDGAATANEVTSNSIKSRRLNFRLKKETRDQLNQIVFEKVK